MKVITLGPKKFEEACRQLARKISVAFPEGFDVIVGIPRGGKFVAEKLLNDFPDANYTEIQLQRDVTKYKKGAVNRVLKRLPTTVTNLLRIIESYLLRKRPVADKEVRIPDLSLPSSCKRVLLVDDAVDSGRTLLAVKNIIKELAPDASVVTAVITVTTKDPVIIPDVRLYNALVLVRFPWSADFNPERHGGC